MADWYISSAAYASIAVWAASTAYTVGQLVRPTAPTVATSMVFRCTTAGTSGGSEPTWSTALNNNATRTDGTATWTNVTGQSTYGWSAAAGTLYALVGTTGAGTNRNLAGDRVFVASDHSETIASGTPTYRNNNATAAFGLVQYVSVNRAGSVPPVTADIQTGAAITTSTGTLILEADCNAYWEGFSFTQSGTGNIYLNSAAYKAHNFKNCALAITGSTTTSRIRGDGPGRAVLDNTTVKFGHASQQISNNNSNEWIWLNTPSAIQGATIPTTLFQATAVSNGALLATCRGVDLSAISGNLLNGSGAAASSWSKVLLDSCKIASGVTRQGSSFTHPEDEIELVNCFDGTNYLNERYTPAGAVTTDRSTTLSGGAQDDVGAYSLKLVSLTRADKSVFTLDSFWLDVENTAVGSSKTATVEIISSGTLNNDDVSLLLEYMGTAGSSIASFVSSLPAVLTTGSALASSSATWGGLNLTWSGIDHSAGINITNNNLTMTTTTTNIGGRSFLGFGTGKYYFELTVGTWTSSSTSVGIGINTTALTPVPANQCSVLLTGAINLNGSNTGSTLSSRASGNIIGIAVDATARLIWFRVAPSGNWNGSGSANPATGAGGINISSLTGDLYAWASLTLAGGADSVTVNFGASAFSGTMPSGFTAVNSMPMFKQKLQAVFTPQCAGRVRGLVRLGKPSTTVWVNPQLTIT